MKKYIFMLVLLLLGGIEAQAQRSFSIFGPTTVCQGATETYSAGIIPCSFNSTITYYWTVSGGTVIGSRSNSLVQVVWNNTGNRRVSLTVNCDSGGGGLGDPIRRMEITQFPELESSLNYSLNVTVNTAPAVPSTTDAYVCSVSDLARLAVANPISGYTYHWYTSASGSSSITTTDPNGYFHEVTGEQTFYVAAYNGACEGERSMIRSIVAETPTHPPTINGSTSACASDLAIELRAVYVALPGASTPSFHWYEVLPNGTEQLVHTGDLFMAPVRLATYRAKAFIDESCGDGPSSQDFTISQINAAPNVSLTPTKAIGDKLVDESNTTVEAVLAAMPNDVTYYWSNDLVPSTSDSMAIIPQQLQNGEKIHLFAYNGCWSEPVTYTAITKSTDFNWTMLKHYNEHGEVVSATKSYYDYTGMLLQTQSKSYADQTVIISQPVYDNYNRISVQALSAPTDEFYFNYKENFITTNGGNAYTEDQFGQPLDQTEKGSLGWYYSQQNTLEELTPATAYPYHRTEFYDDGRSGIKRAAKAGEQLQIGGGHETYAKSFPLLQELDESADLANHSGTRFSYLYVRNQLVFADNTTAKPISLAFKGVKEVVRDEQGREAVEFIDLEGNSIATAAVGEGHNQLIAPVHLPVKMPVYWANFSHQLTDTDLQLLIEGTDYIQVYRSFDGANYSLIYDGTTETTPGGAISVIPARTGTDPEFVYFQVRSFQEFEVKVRTEKCEILPSLYINEPVVEVELNLGMKVGDTGLGSKTTITKQLGDGIDGTHDGLTVLASGDILTNKSAQFSANRKIVLKKFHAKPGSSFKATINDCHPTGWIDDIPVHASAEGQAIFDFHIPVNNTAYTLAAVGFTNAGIPIKIIRLDSDLAEEVVYEGLHNGVGLPTSLNKGFYRILAGLSTSSNLPYLTDYSTTGLQLSYQYPMGQLSYSFYNDVEDMVCTISPNGVQQLKEGVDYQDIDKSTWVFNVESQVINRADKDDGELQYVYSKNATERFKQNAQQKLDNRYAYVAYDKSGRLIETGEYRGTDYVFSLQPTVGNDVYDILESKSNTSTEINGLSRQFCFDATRSFYDRPANLPASVNRTQDYLMGQVSYTEYQPDPNESVTSRNYFSYDEFGRMVWLAQELEGLGVKVIDYEYDYFGNVTKVIYQKDVPEEAFYHQYTYNIDQRLVKVETSRDGVAWVTQAKYEYYLHGPLKRVELGDDGDELQGIDYAYTINGWLKSINNVDVSNDIGGDGKPGALPQDVFNLQLEYFMGDYRSAKQHNPIMAVDIAAGQVPEQFGGNIAVASWRTQKPLGVNEPTYGADSYAYWYDDNDQLTQARFGFLDGLDTYESYQDERYSLRDVTYDLNGNIKTLERLGRFGENAAPVHSFNYTYATNTNQLEEIIGYGEYEYNAIGQLVTQVDWENQNDNLYLNYNAHGKVTEVTSTNLSAKYAYDVGGFRYKKEVNGKETYYVRSGGSIVAVYQKDDNDELKLIELPIYGLNRIGVKTLNAYKEWEDRYELKDHLGNVRVVFREGKARNKNFFTSIEDGTLVNGQAATENEPLFEYEGNEGVIKSLAKAHTGNMSVVLDGDDPLTQRGPHIWLPVERGDDLFAEVYFQADELPENGGVSQPNGRVAGSSFVKNTSLLAVQSPQKGIVGESGQTLPSINLNLLAIPHVLNITSQRPVTTSTNTPTLNYYTAWVRMELYENKDDTEATDSKAAQITLMSDQTGQWKVASLFWEGIEMPDTWCSGYVKVYFENKGSIPIWFDDVSVEHIHNPPKVEVIAYTDYYPFGAKMRESCLKGVRFGYQGEYAEHDTETGWSNFELRLYDPIIGRWLSPDPYAQYWSPYLAMGNNPVNQIDPNGGFSDPIKKGDPTLNAAGTQRFGLNAFTDQMEWSDIFMGMDIIGERSFWDKVGGFFNKHAEAIQNTLDVIGMLEIPIVSQVADIASAGVSLAQGHYGEAAMGVLAALPIVGGAAAAGKRLLKLKRLKKAADGATDAGKVTAKNKEKLKFGGCFVQGTQVLTERGLVDIKKIVSNLGQRTTQSINHSFKAINLFYYSLISVLALVIFGRYYINIKK